MENINSYGTGDNAYYSDRSLFGDFLRADESLMWNGRSEKGNILDKTDIFLIPFSIFWFGFSIFWTVMASYAGGFFGLFGLPFICVGIYLTFGRFISRKKAKRNTYYAVTDKRILLISGKNTLSVNEYDIAKLDDIKIEIRKDGKGNILFVDMLRYGMNNRYNGAYGSGNVNPFGTITYEKNFMNIKNVKKVYDLINSLKIQSR